MKANFLNFRLAINWHRYSSYCKWGGGFCLLKWWTAPIALLRLSTYGFLFDVLKIMSKPLWFLTEFKNCFLDPINCICIFTFDCTSCLIEIILVVFYIWHDNRFMLRLVHLSHRGILLLVKMVTLVSDMLPLFTEILLTQDDSWNKLKNGRAKADEYVWF